MKANLPKTLIVLLLAVAGNIECRAQLATWEITGSNASLTNPDPADALGSQIASARLGLGAGITASGAANTFGGSGFSSTSLASAIAANQYLSVTITPNSNQAISISSISFLTGLSTAFTYFHGELLSSRTGFSAGSSLYSYTTGTTTPSLQSATLSGFSALQNVNGPIEFRLYGWHDGSGSTTFRFRSLSGSDVTISGSTSAVPEPGTYAVVIGVMSLAGAAYLRKRRDRT